ncbi:hypothetical protein CH302_19370 [Rhodococcus sp. 15-2388-1-1a]|uniref:major capsid protein n=1 Tax=Nocardiaceae TaxID=85025 RepID=UPI000690FD3C|nr:MULTISPECIES: major capsid protein [Rhodococcus]OZE95102.1 hypothetical protein CH302_19370 [Rhodococcus sp. 15-2388-1-1a]
MDITLQDLVNAVQEAEAGKGIEALTAFLAEHPTLDISALNKEALKQFNELFDGAKDSDDATTAVELLGEVIEGLGAEQGRRQQVVTDRAAKLDELKAKVTKAAPAEGEPAPTDAEVPAEGDAAPADAAAEVHPEGGTDIAPVDAAPAGEAPADAAPAESLAASNTPTPRRRARVDLAAIKATAPRATAPVEQRSSALSVITAAADVPGVSMGSSLDGIEGLTMAAVSRMKALPLGPVAGGAGPDDIRGSGQRVSAGIASISNMFPKELGVEGRDGDEAAIALATDESRLPGGSLVASGGWCSPSETIYELAGELEAITNLIDLPEVQVNRGGIRTTEGPDFSTLFSGAGIGVVKTEAEAIAGYTKAVYRVPCTNFEDTRAGVVHTGIEAGILQNDAYPELTQRVTRGALVAHAHKVNAESIRQVEAQSTSAGTLAFGPSASTAVLNGLSLLATHYRYKYRAADTMALELKLPLWVKEVFRADLAVTSGWSRNEALNITDQQISAWFTQRNLSVQWLYDWQDAYTGITTGFGGAAVPTAWPTSVKAIIHAPGAFIRGRGDVITLNAVYDSTNIKVNDFLVLFAEEKLLVKRRQYLSYVATLPLATNGVTGAPAALTAQGLIAPPA